MLRELLQFPELLSSSYSVVSIIVLHELCFWFIPCRALYIALPAMNSIADSQQLS